MSAKPATGQHGPVTTKPRKRGQFHLTPDEVENWFLVLFFAGVALAYAWEYCP